MNEVATRKASPLADFKQQLGALLDSNEMHLPSNVSPDAFRNAAIVAAQDNPTILQCEAATVFKSVRRLAAAGLVPDGREAALVPFNTKVKDAQGNEKWIKACQAMPMVFGLIKMARRSGDVKDIRAHLVYQNEIDQGRFAYIIGDEESLTHDPILFGDKGEMVGGYAIAKLSDGTLVREFMDKDEIDRIRKLGAINRNKNEPVGIWKDHYPEMAKKTIIRRLTKRLDLSAEDMRHITMDDEDDKAMRDVTPEAPAAPELSKKRGSIAAAIQDDQPAPDPINGEILDAESEDQRQPDPNTLEYAEGKTAGGDETKSLKDCPYEQGTEEWMNWAAGFKAGSSK